jgi:hypothetical protein
MPTYLRLPVVCLVTLTGWLLGALSFVALPASAIEPYQAQSIEPDKAQTTPVVTADPVQPVTGQSIAMQQAGFIRFQAPEGWMRAEQEQSILFLAPEVPKGQLCLLAFLPEEAVKENGRDWFLAATRGGLGEGVKLVTAGSIQEQRTGSGALQLSATQITVNKDGARMYTYYVGILHHARGRLAAYVASSPELFLQHLPEFSTVQQSLTTSETQLGGNPPPSTPPLTPEKPEPAKPEPAKPEPIKPEPAKPAPAAPAKLAVPGGNAVEPLTNGLLLHMTADAVVKKFGQPGSDDRAMGGGIGYAGFGMLYNARQTEIWHLTLKAGPRFNSGIGVGSTRAEVEAVFGAKNPVIYDQYDITFRYDGDRVNEIKIDPAKDKFTPYRPIPLGKSTVKPEEKATRADFVGTWHGTNVASQIIVNADGTWANAKKEKQGTYTIAGNDIIFNGPILKAWNNGRATMKNGNLEFYWKNPDGSINYFAFVKMK